MLIYSLGARARTPGDPRCEIAERLLSRGGILSAQVLNEFTDAASRKLKLSWDKIGSFLEVFESLSGLAVSLTMESHRKALRLSKRFGFRIYDSSILASAIEAGCTVVYTEDMQHGQITEGVRIENPFVRHSVP